MKQNQVSNVSDNLGIQARQRDSRVTACPGDTIVEEGRPSARINTPIPVDCGVVGVGVQHREDHMPELSEAARRVIVDDFLNDYWQGNIPC